MKQMTCKKAVQRLTYKSPMGDYGAMKEYEDVYAEIHALRNALGKYEDLAEQERLIKLPCKVGDAVWVVYENEPLKVFVTAFRFDNKKNSMRVCVKGTVDCSDFLHEYTATFKFSNFGKTVFLSQEEAERTLKG